MQGKTILVTGVLTDHSIAFSVAKLIQEEGGTALLTSFGRAMGATERANGRLPKPATILELDVTSEENLARLLESTLRLHQFLNTILARAPNLHDALIRKQESHLLDLVLISYQLLFHILPSTWH